MKARLLKECEVMEFHPTTGEKLAPDEYVAQCVRRDGRLYAPAGAICSDPDAYMLVKMGIADAADDECAVRCQQTEAERAATLHAAARLSAGIDPADFELFDKGYIAGYFKDGSYKPGPNWSEFKQPTTEDDDE
jgi:hypothetical protein